MLRVSDFIQKSSNCVIHLFVFLAYTLHFIILYSLIIDSVAIHWLLFRLRECVSRCSAAAAAEWPISGSAQMNVCWDR